MAYIYAIGESVNGPVKVGFTTGMVEKRLAELQTASVLSLIALAAVEVPADLARSIEYQLHRLLADHAIRGEWFSVGMTQAKLTLLTEKAMATLESVAEEDPAVFPEPETAPGDFFSAETLDRRFTYVYDDEDIEIGLTVPNGDFSNALARVRSRLAHHL